MTIPNYHYHYNTPSISPPPIINKNIIRINNENTCDDYGSDSSESGDNEGEQFLDDCLSETLTSHVMTESTADQGT